MTNDIAGLQAKLEAAERELVIIEGLRAAAFAQGSEFKAKLQAAESSKAALEGALKKVNRFIEAYSQREEEEKYAEEAQNVEAATAYNEMFDAVKALAPKDNATKENI